MNVLEKQIDAEASPNRSQNQTLSPRNLSLCLFSKRLFWHFEYFFLCRSGNLLPLYFAHHFPRVSCCSPLGRIFSLIWKDFGWQQWRLERGDCHSWRVAAADLDGKTTRPQSRDRTKCTFSYGNEEGLDKMETQARRRNNRPADEQPGHSIAGTCPPIQMIIAPLKGGYRNFFNFL